MKKNGLIRRGILYRVLCTQQKGNKYQFDCLWFDPTGARGKHDKHYLTDAFFWKERVPVTQKFNIYEKSYWREAGTIISCGTIALFLSIFYCRRKKKKKKRKKRPIRATVLLLKPSCSLIARLIKDVKFIRNILSIYCMFC